MTPERLRSALFAQAKVDVRSTQRVKRVFDIDLESCTGCGGKLRVMASIEEPEVIAKILAHLERTAPDQYPSELPLGARVPPVQSRLLRSWRGSPIRVTAEAAGLDWRVPGFRSGAGKGRSGCSGRSRGAAGLLRLSENGCRR